MTIETLTDNPDAKREKLHEPLSRVELEIIGSACLEAAMRQDLGQVVAEHAEQTGVGNPNKHRPGFFVGQPETGVVMNGENAYRSVDRRAIDDLASTGIVRGAYTATNGERSNTISDATFWSDGKEGGTHDFASPGHFVIEAPIEELEKGWVTADKITAIHARDEDGATHDILKMA